MRTIISFILLFFSINVFAQEKMTTIVLSSDPGFVTGDVLGNIYIVKGSEVIKYNASGTFCCSFSDRTYGEITSIDVRDPLRILIFYKPFAIIRLLDNNLAEQSLIDLRKLDLADPLLVCTSEIQGTWVYDNATSRLYKFDSAWRPVSLSNDLRQDIMRSIYPVHIAESDYWLIMLDKSSLLVFDKMGSYFKPIMIDPDNKGLLSHDEWISISGNMIVRLNIRNGKMSETALPFVNNAGTVYVLPRKIARITDKKLEIYSN
jgi:hypothetical protein